MTLSNQWTRLRENLRPEVLIDTTLLILKSHSNFGVANGATKPPEAASTWILGKAIRVGSKTRECGNLRNGHPALFLVLVQKLSHLFDRFIVASVGTPENDEHANRILVNVLHGGLGVESVVTLLADRY